MKYPSDASPGIFQRCPHLGLQDDRSTSLAYPSAWNYCYRAIPADSVAVFHQEAVCLTAAHRQCPVFLRTAAAPLPADLRGRHEAVPGWSIRRSWMIIMVILLISTAAAAYFLGGIGIVPTTVLLSPTPFAPGTNTARPSATVTITPVTNQVQGIIASFTADALTRIANFTPTPRITGTPPTATITSTSTRTSTPTKTLTPTKTPTIALSPLPTAARTFAPPPANGVACGHPLDTPFGGSIKFLLHRILPGENLTIYATTYGTSTAAILAVNYRLPLPVWADWIVVIPFQTDDVANVPPFEPYQAVDARISLEELARQLNTDATMLKTYNGFQQTCSSFSGWLLVPRPTP